MVEIDDLPSRSLGASRNLREKPSSRKNIREINCAICHKFTKNNFYDKHRIAVDSQAKNFLKIDSMMHTITFWIVLMHIECMIKIYTTIVHA